MVLFASPAAQAGFALHARAAMTRRWVYFFGQGQADGSGEIKHLIGGKGASLADMTRAHLNVPPGFTISAECCEHFHRHEQHWPDGLDAQIRDSLAKLEAMAGRPFGVGETPLLLAVRSGAAQSMPGMMDTVLNVGLNPDTARALAERTGNARGAWEAYLHFLLMFCHTVGGIEDRILTDVANDYLAEVGHARQDDLDAGQLEDFCLRLHDLYRACTNQDLPADPWSMLCAAINAVFHSWNTERAIAYRKHHHIDGLLGTAVNVQIMCPSEVSGVLFTANPVNPALGEIIIESSYGLGEAVVLGKVTPDRFVLDRRTLAVKEKVIARKQTRTATLAEGGYGQTGADDSASLSDAQVQELAELGCRVEQFFKTPCDVEWALSQGQFYLLQSRPIKASNVKAAIDPAEREKVRLEEISALKLSADPLGTVWSRYNLSEILPEPTPMTWSIVRRFMAGQGGYGQMYRDLGYAPDPAIDDKGIFDLVAGRPYCNLSREPLMQFAGQPFSHSFDELKQNPARAVYPQAVLKPTFGYVMTFPLHLLRETRRKAKQEALLGTFLDDFEQRILPPYLAEVDRAIAEDWSGHSPKQLHELLEFWNRRTLFDFARDSLKPTALTAILMSKLEAIFAVRLQPTLDKEGQAVGKQKAEAVLRELMMGSRPTEDADFAKGVQALCDGVATKAEFLKQFGHRGSQEMELAQPRWAEDPAAVDRLLDDRYAGSSDAHCSPDDWRKIWPRIADEAKFLPTQRPAMEAEIAKLHRFMGLRESAKHYLLKGYALIRRALVELDRRFQLEGGVFYLTKEELPELLQQRENNVAPAIRERIAARRKRREIALSLPAPQVIFSDDLEAIGRELVLDASATMQGTPLSAGVGEAAAWVLDDVAGAKPPGEPYILVCPSTDPSWLPLFLNAKGLVMETGGVLSHGAIVAREFGLPAVAGIPDVHRRLKTGQRLRVDGATGKVSVLG
jgi:phosphohistidine swiveling domain-containing protein